MTATVTASRRTANSTRRPTWRTGDGSSWAMWTPVCSVSAPTCPCSTPRTIRSGGATARAAAPERVRRGSARDLLPFLRGEFPLEHLAGRRHRDGVDEDDVAQPLVRRHLVVDGGHDRLGGQRAAGVVGPADDV